MVRLNLNQVIAFFWLFMLLIFSVSCDSENNEGNENDSLIAVKSKSFSVADYNFAILQDKKFIPYNKAIYHRGDDVYLVLENVGPFRLDNDSLNKAEMKILVTDAIGQQVSMNDSILGERGHKKFLNNTLSSPYGLYESDANDKPGKYTLCVTIYDLISRDSIVVCDDFFIE